MAPAPAPAPTPADDRPQERQQPQLRRDDEIDFLKGPDADVLRAVIKTLGGGVVDEGDAMFPLLDDEVAQEEVAERARSAQARLERRCDFLARRLRLGQARAVGLRAAEECRAAFEPELPQRATVAEARRLVRRLERSAALPKGGGASEADAPAPRTNNPSAAPTAARLRAHLSLVERRLDSDATASSSGAESNDEGIPYANVHQRRMPPTKRALWKWAHDRASIASKWTWLQAQIQELEYKIRQHTELQRRVRAAKGTSALCEPSGYTGRLPGQTGETDDDDDETCVRVRPLNRSAFRKRKLLQMHNLHTATEKAAKPSNIRCICQWPLGSCAVCTGRVLPTHPLPYTSTLTKQERLALVDPAYHPVLSTYKEISTSVQYSAKMKIPNWQQKSASYMLKALKSNNVSANAPQQLTSKLVIVPNKSKKKKHSKSKKGKSNTANPFDRNVQIKRRTSVYDGMKKETVEGGSPQAPPLPSGSSSPVPSPSDHRHRPRERTERSRLNSSYDIDNIVIPHSIAASTKLEILQYKEILTPKWRIVDIDDTPSPNNGIIKKVTPVSEVKEEVEEEDVTEGSVVSRHERCEQLEKGKYLQKRKSSRRQNSRSGTGSNPPLTPSETPPHTPATMLQVDETSTHSESAITNITSTSTSMVVNTSNTTAATSFLSAPILSAGTSTSEPSIVANLQSHSSAPISNKRRLTLQAEEVEIVPPYSPRVFPLTDETYEKMLLAMPDNHPLSTYDTPDKQPSTAPSCHIGSDSESNSVQLYCHQVESLVEGNDAVMGHPSDSDADSYSAPPEEDPNDPEWNASVHAD